MSPAPELNTGNIALAETTSEAHVLGNDCDIVFIPVKSTEKVQWVTLLCSCYFTDTVTEVWVAVK